MKMRWTRVGLALVGLLLISSVAMSPTLARPAAAPRAMPAAPAQGPGSPWKMQWHGQGDLLDVHFAGLDTIWATGTSGLILRSSDGGTFWQLLDPRIDDDLWAVQASDQDNAWAAGANGTIIRTMDGGHTWAMQPSGTTGTLYDLCLVNDNAGWAVGESGTIIHTGDGGTSWQAQASGSDEDLYGIHCSDPQVAWAAGEAGTILYTADGGSSWQSQTSGTGAGLRSVSFADASTGWAVGGLGEIRATNDGGATWLAQTSPVARELLAVDMASADSGWIVGAAGTILYTADGGATWGQQDSETVQALRSVSAWDATRVMAVGAERDMRLSSDAGSTWRLRGGGSLLALRGVDFVNDQNGWAVGERGDQRAALLHTEDGGKSWAGVEIRRPDGTLADSSWLNDVDFIDENTGWTFGRMSRSWKTTDGGQNWQLLIVDSGQPYAYRIQFYDANEGWISQNPGKQTDFDVGHTTDGGESWDLLDVNGINGPAGAMHWDPDRMHGWVVAQNYNYARASRSQPYGDWEWDAQPWPDMIRDVYFLPGSPVGYMVGSRGPGLDWGATIWKSEDYGVTWENQLNGEEDWGDVAVQALRGVFFIDEDTGWAAGANGIILHTTDGGRNWAIQPSGTTEHLGAGWPLKTREEIEQNMLGEGDGGGGGITFVGDKGWVVGQAGVILHYPGRASNTWSYQTSSPPTVDGHLWDWVTETGLRLDQDRADGLFGISPPEGPVDISAEMRTMWDADHLYLAVNVWDDLLLADSETLVDDDCLVLGVDGALDHEPGGADDHEYSIGWDGRVTDFGVPTTAIQAAAQITPEGYTVEVAIPYSELGSIPLAHDRIIGLALGLRDDDDGGAFDNVLILDGEFTDYSSAEYGSVHLLGDMLTLRHRANDYSIVHDTTISNWEKNRNFNSGDERRFLLLRPDVYSALLYFDLGVLDPNLVIDEAILHVYADMEITGTGNPVTVKSYRLLQHWDPDDVTWNNRTADDLWSQPGANDTNPDPIADRTSEPSDAVQVASLGDQEFDITAMAVAWDSDLERNHGAILIADPGPRAQYRFATSEHWEDAWRPRLEVSYHLREPDPTPTPTASPTPTATATSTPTATPTQTPTPTDTPEPTPSPTATPRPTDTPSPTATATPTEVPSFYPAYLPLIIREE